MPMNSARSHIVQAYVAYTQYLKEGGNRIHLPEKEAHDPEKAQGLVFPSDLTMCPLAARFKREAALGRFQESENAVASSQTIMNLGNFYEDFLAEALIYTYGEQNVLRHVSAEGFGARGRIDILLTVEGQDYLLEVKSSAPFGKAKDPHPKKGHVFQVLFYRMIIGDVPTSIVMFNRHAVNGTLPFKVWDIVKKSELWNGYRVLDEDRYILDEAWNTNDLCYEAVLAEIQRHANYLSGNRSDIPIPDFLNDPAGWQCCYTTTKPKPYKTERNALQYGEKPAVQRSGGDWVVPGVIAPRCPWFCHDIPADTELLVSLDDEDRLIPIWEIGVF